MDNRKCKIIVFLSIIILFCGGCERKVVSPEIDENGNECYSFYILTNPSGAAVYINNKNTGYITPCKLDWIEAKDTSVLLKLSPFLDYKFSVDPDKIKDSSYYYDFTLDDRNFGMVNCETTPAGADIYLNDSLTNIKTPYTYYLRPGDYEFKFKMSEYRSDSISVSVPRKDDSLDIVNISKNLIDTSLFVDYTRESKITVCNSVYLDESSGIVLVQREMEFRNN